MAVVAAFGTLANTIDAGLTTYYHAPGVTSVDISLIIPILSKVTAYEPEYVIGEMKIWDSGSESVAPNNCAMVRIMAYADGWIVAWFDKEAQNQFTGAGFTYVNGQTLAGFGTEIEYPDQWNGCLLTVDSSIPPDSNCPDGTDFCILDTDVDLGRIEVHYDPQEDGYYVGKHFSSGHTYTVSIYHTNGNLVWFGHTSSTYASPAYMSNRLYRALYDMWELMRRTSDGDEVGYAPPDYGYQNDALVWKNYTSQLVSTTLDDVWLLPSVEYINDAFYFGASDMSFAEIKLKIDSVPTGGSIAWEYWNGTAWGAIPGVIDNTNGYIVTGTNSITYTKPGDWEKTIVNGIEAWWIRARCIAFNYSGYCRCSQGWLLTVGTVEYDSADIGMYSFEDTSANYCLLYGITIYAYGATKTEDDYFYSTVLPGKTIYKHSAVFGSKTRGGTPANIIQTYVNNRFLACSRGNSSTEQTDGFIIFDVKDIAGTIAVQNVFHAYGHTGTSTYDYVYGNMASVLITS